MNGAEARQIAEQELDRSVRRTVHDVVIAESATHEIGDYWVFFYDTREHIETGALEQAMVGNVPLLVNKTTGRVRFARPVVPIADQLAEDDDDAGDL